MPRKHCREIHSCTCESCVTEPQGEIAEEHRAINRLVAGMDEKRRRRLVGFLAHQHGRGGIASLFRITGLSPKTIRRGIRESQPSAAEVADRVRRPGGGRKRLEQLNPGVVQALDDLLRDITAGDPMSELKWTHKSTLKLCRALRHRGFVIGRKTVARLLRERHYSLRTNRKCLARKQHPDRDRQFRFLTRQRQRYVGKGWPVISVDAKKREMVGNFKNPGRCWRREAREVLDHDFRKDAAGIAISYGIYDLHRTRLPSTAVKYSPQLVRFLDGSGLLRSRPLVRVGRMRMHLGSSNSWLDSLPVEQSSRSSSWLLLPSPAPAA
jgi:hypothetical protein